MRYVAPQLTNVGEALDMVLGSQDFYPDDDHPVATANSPWTTDGSLAADV
jgi:hypothetical protein